MRLFEKLLASGEKRFALLVIEGLRRAGESRPIQFERERFRLMVGGNAFPLSGFYEEYRTATQHVRSGVVRRAVQSWRVEARPRGAAAVSPERLLPVLLPRAAVELLRLNADDESVCPHQVIGENLAATIGLAGEPASLDGEALAKAGLDFTTGWQAACDNLRRCDPSADWTPIASSCFACESDDRTAATRLLLSDQIAELRLAGDPVAIVPDADVLLVAGADDPNALRTITKRARNEFQHAQSLSGFAYRWSGGEWRRWLPTRTHPAHATLKLLELETLARDYMQQKRYFEELGRKAGEPMCLATFSAMQHERTGEPMSFTVWPEGLEIMLPEADEVVFFQPDATGENGCILARVPWERVRLILGDLMEPLESYPPRWLVRDFPHAQRLAELDRD
jgi:hypothetical protein